MPQIDEILRHMKDLDASDVHLMTGAPVTFRILGDLIPANEHTLTRQEIELLLYEILTAGQIESFEHHWDLDTSYTVPGYARFRVSVFQQHRGPGAVMRLIPEDPPTLASLGFPELITRMSETQRGLILMTGPTNSGKTTTLAAMVNHLNETQKKHIITLEDPLEFVHKNKRCLITQRQVGAHSHDFATALRAALRQDPNVIMVGEMRDLETIHLALTAAELGLCVFGTLHTKSAAQTINRVIDAFPYEQQSQIRTLLSESLRGVISQQLVKRADGRGRVAALEIMVNTPAIANMIREGKTHQIPSTIQTSRRDGMQLMEQHLAQLFESGIITREAAAGASVSPNIMAAAATGTASEPVA